MIHRERILRTLRGEPTDRIPRGEFYASNEFVHAFLNEAGVEIQFQDYQAVVEQLDLDIASVPFSAGWGALQQPDEDRALDSLLRWRGESDRFVFALIDGPFSTAVKARGFDMLMRYVHSAPQFALEDFQRGGAETRMVAQAVRDAGADGVILGEDMAYNKSTFFSPAQLRELYFPTLQDVVHDLRALGLVVFFHSDGNLNLIMDDLGACDLDGIQGLEPEAGMEIAATRRRIGPALTLWGNFSFEFLSAARTDAEIAVTLQNIEMANGGGRHLIIGSCAGLVQGLNVGTVRRVYA
jgi:uroporphyrinogen decarboxylase